MAHINLTINGRNYGMECGDGQEPRVQELGKYIEARLKAIAASGAGQSENHLLVLTALMMADEVFDLRDNLAALGEHVEGKENQDQHDLVIAQAIEQLAGRIDGIAARVLNS